MAEDLLDRIKECLRLASSTEANQRKRERDDLAFQVPENQWDEAAKIQRQGGTGTNATPPRPMLSISLIQQPMQLVQNQAAAADLGVNIHPVSEEADEELAEIKQGLYRRIERDSNAQQVRLWAFDRAKQCGRGWYRVLTQWDEDGDNPFDQEIIIKRILHQDMVYMDPAATEPDFSDAEWGMICAWVKEDVFKRLYPNASLDASSSQEFDQMNASAPQWTMMDGDKRAYLVAEYWYKIHNYQEIEYEGRKRVMDQVAVKRCTCTGGEILSEENWDGKYIPIIPVIGRELQPFDSERRWEGMVRPARDGQKLVNFAASTMVERMATEIKTPFIGAKGQFEGFESQWQQANTRNFPYIEYNAIGADGKPIPPPQRAQLDQTGMSLAMMAFQEGKGYVQAATAVYDPSLGETPKRGQSGRAVIAQQQQSDAGTSNYLQSLAKITMPYEAKVVLDLIPHVYDRPGRVTRVLGGEDEEPRKVMLGVPFRMEGERPIETQEGAQGAKYYDLSKGKYAISVSIGKSYQTRLQQGQEEFGELLQNLPPEMQLLLLPTYMKFRDTPGAKEAAELMKKFRDSKFPGLTGEEGQEPTPEQMKAQLQAQGQQMQQMQAQMQEAMQFIKTEQAKQQGQIQKAQIDAQKAIEIERMRAATSINVAQINAEAKGFAQETEAQTEAIALGRELSHESDENDEQRAHEVALESMKERAARAQAQEQADRGEAEAERGRGHEAGMQAMTAATKPKEKPSK